jgi:uncharacterized protein
MTSDATDGPTNHPANGVTRPLPLLEPETAPFWRALADGTLLIQRCERCGLGQFYPRPICMTCGGPVQWEATSGRGVVYTFTVVRQNGAAPFDQLVPYVLAMIDIEPGVRMLGNVIECDVDTVSIGQRVEVTFREEAPGAWLPFWRLAVLP